MSRNNKSLLILVAAGVIAYLFYLGLYYAQTAYDKWMQPWAYSTTAAEKRLVGKWTGNYTDPDRKTHTLQIEIFEPQSAEKRWQQVTRRHHRGSRSRKSRNTFNGIGYIISEQKTDSMQVVSGHIAKAEAPTDISFDIAPMIDDNYPVGFQLAFLRGIWTGSNLELNGEFVYHTPSGSGYSDSADPRFDYKAKMVMSKMQ